MEVKNTIESTVVMLPTTYVIGMRKPRIYKFSEDYYENKSGDLTSAYNAYAPLQIQHIYFTSDEEINEGNQVLSSNNHIYQILKRQNGNLFLNGLGEDYSLDLAKLMRLKKIVASTDVLAGIALIPSEWLKNKYVPSKGAIKTVRLELEHITRMEDELKGDWSGKDVVRKTHSNEVVIIDDAKEESLTDVFAQLGEIMNPHLTDANPVYKAMMAAERVAPTWKKCSDDIPAEEVIALLDGDTKSVIVGFIEKSARSPTAFNCVNESHSETMVFMNCTHYILVSELLKFEKE